MRTTLTRFIKCKLYQTNSNQLNCIALKLTQSIHILHYYETDVIRWFIFDKTKLSSLFWSERAFCIQQYNCIGSVLLKSPISSNYGGLFVGNRTEVIRYNIYVFGADRTFCLSPNLWPDRVLQSSEVFSWRQVDFEFPDERTRRAAIASGEYVQANNLPLGLGVWRDKVFITVPRWKAGVASTLNYVRIESGNLLRS